MPLRLDKCDKSDSGDNDFTIAELTFTDDEILIKYREKSAIVIINY